MKARRGPRFGCPAGLDPKECSNDESKAAAGGAHRHQRYILEDDQTNLAAVIDPGDEPELIQEALEKEGVEVRYLLLTHGHYDHTTAVPALHRVYPQADIYIHQADANGAGSTLFPLAGEVDDLKLYDEGDVIRLGDHEIQVLHTPGHSPGSVTLKVEDVLFTGDTLFAGSCGRTEPAGGSYEQIMRP